MRVCWEQRFLYKDARVTVTRLDTGWRVRMGGRQEESRAFVTALENLLGHGLGQADNKLVLAAFARYRDYREEVLPRTSRRPGAA